MIRRVDLKRLAEVRDGLFFVAPILVGGAPVVVGDGIVRVEGDGLGVIRNRAVDLALVTIGAAPVVVVPETARSRSRPARGNLGGPLV